MYQSFQRSFFATDTAPQLDYVTFLHTEEALTTFVNACAQAGATKCFPVRMIKGKATGSDVRKLITSTIDVSMFTTMYLCIEGGLSWVNSSP